jgi:hypothetical protein
MAAAWRRRRGEGALLVQTGEAACRLNGLYPLGESVGNAEPQSHDRLPKVPSDPGEYVHGPLDPPAKQEGHRAQ